MDKTYSAEDVQNILDIKRSRIQFYIGEKLFEPESSGEGKGVRRVFSKRNIAELYLIIELFNLGLHKDQVRYLISFIKSQDSELKEKENQVFWIQTMFPQAVGSAVSTT